MSTQTVLSVTGLSKSFRAVKAVRDVSFTIPKGKTFGLVGESGSGKSTTARLVLRLVEPTTGAISFRGRDLAGLSARDLRAERRHMQMIFQDPFGSLNPRMSVRDALVEPQLVHGIGTPAEQLRTAERLLGEVSMPRAALDRYPHEFSGGQRQRIAIARALSSQPEFIVCDEPTSALDVSVQAQVLDLMQELQDEFGLTYLLISHNLAVVRQMSSAVGVLHNGVLVEKGPTDAIFDNPQADYTKMLLDAVPDISRVA